MKNSNLKVKFQYDWIVYLLIVIFSVLLWCASFAIYHQPKSYESITLFLGGEVKNYDFEEEGKKISDIEYLSVSSINPSSTVFATKYSVVGLNNSDLIFVPESIAKETSCSSVFLELNDSYNTSFFIQDGKNYGLLFDSEKKEHLSSYFSFIDEDYYLFFASNSLHNGDYDSKNFTLAKWMLNYEEN